jgi:hypothetical protein
MKMKQRYQRTYEKGRPTNGWDKGERITDTAQVKPGDVLIAVSNQFQAENLVRVIERECPIGDGFDYQYADPRTLERSDGGTMFCHGFMLAGPQQEYYRAIDRRPKPKRIRNLPAWPAYKRA